MSEDVGKQTMSKPDSVDSSGASDCSTAFFDSIIVQRLNDDAPDPDLSNVDPMTLLVFAVKEAYCHIRGRAPNVADDDELAGRSRAAFFVCEALLTALEVAGDEESSEWGEQ